MSAVVAARRGRTADALRMVSGMIAGVDRGTVPAWDVATIYALLGRRDDAFHWLERSFSAHEPTLIALRTDLFMVSLHADPRFAALLRRIGLPA
jgi:hypothetical protein